MFLEVALEAARLAAVGAGVGREARMHRAMLEQIRLESKRLPAYIASEWLLISVNYRVLLQT